MKTKFSLIFAPALLICVVLTVQPVFCAKVELQSSVKKIGFGHEVPEKQVSLANKGMQKIFWSAQSNQPWVTIQPALGEIEAFDSINSDSEYYFSTMFPQLPDNWYFPAPMSVGRDHAGNIYVVDRKSGVKKFNQYEEFLFEIGKEEYGSIGYLYQPVHIAFDSKDNFYVTDSGDIKKYDKQGNFVSVFKQSSGDFYADDIAIDSADNIFVTDGSNYCVHKLNKSAALIKSWGSQGVGENQFYPSYDNFRKRYVMGIVVDSKNNVYVADNHYSRIQNFDSDGKFIKQIRIIESIDFHLVNEQRGEIFAIDSKDVIYIGHNYSNYIKKYNSEGVEISSQLKYTGKAKKGKGKSENYNWWDFSKDYNVGDAAIDSAGNVYFCSPDKSIIKLDPAGNKLEEWKSNSSAKGRLNYPTAIALDISGNVYVGDNGYRLQKFNTEGKLLKQWNFADYEFDDSVGMAVDSKGNIYVGNVNVVWKVGSKGKPVVFCESKKFEDILSVAIGPNDELFVYSENLSDQNAPNIFQLDAKGAIINEEVATQIKPNEQALQHVTKISVDPQGNLYLFCDDIQAQEMKVIEVNPDFIVIRNWSFKYNSEEGDRFEDANIDPAGFVFAVFSSGKVRKFDGYGDMVTQWSGAGSTDGRLNLPSAIVCGPQGKVAVLDKGNDRVQIFSQAVMPVSIILNRDEIAGNAGDESSAVVSFYDDGDASKAPVTIKISAFK